MRIQVPIYKEIGMSKHDQARNSENEKKEHINTITNILACNDIIYKRKSLQARITKMHLKKKNSESIQKSNILISVCQSKLCFCKNA